MGTKEQKRAPPLPAPGFQSTVRVQEGTATRVVNSSNNKALKVIQFNLY